MKAFLDWRFWAILAVLLLVGNYVYHHNKPQVSHKSDMLQNFQSWTGNDYPLKGYTYG
jgi:hypothetical protein